MFLQNLADGLRPWTGGHRQPETLIEFRDREPWTGAHRQTSSGSWTWSDGAPWSFTNWGPRRPDIFPSKQSNSGYQFILLF